MTLEETIELTAELSDNIEDNELRAEILLDLMELKLWRKNPFLMIKKHCETVKKCNECPYDSFCCGHTGATVPEEWKF